MKPWHTRLEKDIIRRLKGRDRVSSDHDGILNGRPLEIKAVKKDNRFRIQREAHRRLIRQKGVYVFVNKNNKIKKLKARAVSKLLGKGKWFKDRDYPHRFLKVKEVF